MTVQFGTFVPQGWRMDLVEFANPVAKYEAMTAVAKAVDEIAAYDSIWVYDHFHTVPQPTHEAVFECWTITAALTRDTKRVNVGQMVTCNGYRDPAVLAKMASTVDVMSHGRLYCGLGAGWYEHEWKAYGFGFPETRERMRAFREAVQLVTKMWTEDTPTFDGEYYHIHGPINEPKGVRKPHPSLWLGGGGETITLKLVAKYANACNLGGGNPEVIKQKLEVLQQHCEAVGRNYAEIIKSTSVNIVLLADGADPEQATEAVRKTYGWSLEELKQQSIVGTAEEIAAKVQAAVDAGANYIITYFPRIAYDHTPMQRFAEEVVPMVG